MNLNFILYKIKQMEENKKKRDPLYNLDSALDSNTEKKKVKKRYWKKTFLILTILFVFLNIWLYKTEYTKYVENAPVELKEARKELTKAYMVHIYYGFLVKTLRIDFQNKLISPIKNFRDYFYHKGLDKLPKDEAERAIWFSLFEKNLYNSSVRGGYGALDKRYGAVFAEKFIDDVYKNIEIFSLYKFRDKQSDISSSALEDYISLITIYLFDFNINIGKYRYSKEVFDYVSSNEKFHNKLLNIYKWQKLFLEDYKQNHTIQYKKTLTKLRGWYSPYVRNKRDEILLSSFILFYKIRNGIFECEQDKKFLQTIKDSRIELLLFMVKYRVNKRFMRTISRELEYSHIKNDKDNVKIKSKNFFDLSVSCEIN